MQIPLQITFRETSDPTGAIKAKIHEQFEKLNRDYNNIISCQIVVEAPHHSQHKGNLYQVRINLSVPKHTFVVSSESRHDHTHEDVYVALRDAFDALTSQLKSYRHEEHGDVKVHSHHPQGTISLLKENYGRIDADDGSDIYFHRNSVTHGNFDTLTAGQRVEFETEMGDDGLQATFVKCI